MKLQIDNLSKSYGDRKVLDIDALTIKSGLITGITGPNGCGKSTLLNIISGLDDEFSGRITYNNQSLNSKITENMTYVFQKPYLFKRSVYENIAYPLKLRKISLKEIDKRVVSIIKAFEIEDLKDKRADRLSGGESQKVALARGMVFEPDLLLLDEPTSNIDPDSIGIMEREILNFNKNRNSTIIIVTHSIGQSERLCDDVIYLEQGRVVYR